MEQVGDGGARATLREAVVQALVALRTVHPFLVRGTALGGRAAGKIRNPKASVNLHQGCAKRRNFKASAVLRRRRCVASREKEKPRA